MHTQLNFKKLKRMFFIYQSTCISQSISIGKKPDSEIFMYMLPEGL